MPYVLINDKTGEPVKVGDTVLDFRGEPRIVESWEAPRHAGSTGRIYTKRDASEKYSQPNYPSVVDCHFELVDEAAQQATDVLSFDRPKLDALRKARQDALDNAVLIFTFEGAPLRVDYAKYLIEYLDSRLPK